MIIFFDKKTGDIFGVVEGRVHNYPEKEEITVSNVSKKDTGKYHVPFKTILKEVKIPIKKWFLVKKDKKDTENGDEVEERTVGYKKETQPNGMVPDVKFASIILEFEAGTKNIYDYRVRLDKNKKVIGFIKKKK